MPFKTAELKRAYYQANKEKYLGYVRKYRALYPEKIKARDKKTRYIYNRSLAGRFQIIRAGARYRGLAFEISRKHLEQLIMQSCYYCGLKGGGLDRIDSNIGYILSNVVPCCWICNDMKGTVSREDFIKRCKLITERNSIWVL